jgi:SAM-dependent methyltransferase
MADLHAGFGEPQEGISVALADFLGEVDRLPGIRAIHQAMRRQMRLRPEMRVLDAGCGTGLELARLAEAHPAVEFTGLDKNAALLATARRRVAPALPNLTWRHAALEDGGLPERHYDVIRTERVLIYAPDPLLDRMLDALIRALRPGGRLVLFELDYGGTILPDRGHGEDVVRAALSVLERALPQHWAGRRLPGLLAKRGLADLTVEPYSFAVNERVWRGIVHDTLRVALDREPDGAPGLRAWLDEHATPGPPIEFYGAFTGVLTTARLA